MNILNKEIYFELLNKIFLFCNLSAKKISALYVKQLNCTEISQKWVLYLINIKFLQENIIV